MSALADILTRPRPDTSEVPGQSPDALDKVVQEARDVFGIPERPQPDARVEKALLDYDEGKALDTLSGGERIPGETPDLDLAPTGARDCDATASLALAGSTPARRDTLSGRETVNSALAQQGHSRPASDETKSGTPRGHSPAKDGGDHQLQVQVLPAQPLSSTSGQPVLPAPVVTLADTLESLVSLLVRYMKFEHTWQPDLCALWVAHTYIYTAFRWTPYLHIKSPEKRCGKSTLMNCLKITSCNGWKIVVPTVAAIYQKMDYHRPTCFLDECDRIFGGRGSEVDKAIESIFLAGFETGNLIPRGTIIKGKIDEVDPYGPKCMAGVKGLPDMLADRAVQIHLTRDLKGNVDEYDDDLAEEEARPIRRFLLTWGLDATKSFRGYNPERPAELNPRQKNVSKVLLTIAEKAGGEWPERATSAVLAAFQDTPEPASTGTMLLASIRRVFLQKDTNFVETDDLVHALIEMADDEPWPAMWERDVSANPPKTRKAAMQIAEMLGEFKISSRCVGEKRHKGYVSSDFLKAWKDYLPGEETLKQETGDLGL